MPVSGPMPFDLAGRTALVTGSSSGIGLAIACALAAAGARVALHGLDDATALEALARTLPNIAHPAPVFSLDLALPGSATALAAGATTALGHVDILVLAAAIQFRRHWAAITPEEFQLQIDVNLKSTLALLQALVPPMQRRGWGRVVTIGSVQQVKPHPEMLVYAGTKSAQLSWVRNLAVQVGADGVTINNMAPGIIDTPRNAEILADAAARARVGAPVPVRRVGVPDDCVGAALLLCSDAGAYITGADIVVDGGLGVV